MIVSALVALAGLVLTLLPPHAPTPTFERDTLTPRGPRYSYAYDDGRLVIRAAASKGDRNRREVFHRSGVRATRDQTSCATWSAESDSMTQEGLAVRIRQSGGGLQAVTVTKNTIFGVHWTFNLLTWDTTRRGDPWRKVAQFDLSEAVGAGPHRLYPLPWRACLRVVERRVTFKVWPLGRVARPSWRDHTYTRRARLPRAFQVSGRPGWYVGHLASRGRVVYRGLTTR